MDKIDKYINYLLTIGGQEPKQVARTIFVYLICGYLTKKFTKAVVRHGFRKTILNIGFTAYKQYKGDSGMNEMLEKIGHDIEKSLIPPEVENTQKNITLPKQSSNYKTLLTTLENWNLYENKLWNGDKKIPSGAVYHGGKDLYNLQCQTFSLFCLTNPLHPETFPFVRKMEAEVIAMTVSLFHGNPYEQCGLVTSGGTESIIMAIRTYKQFCRYTKNITKPELIIPETAHAAFRKGCDLMDIKCICIPVDPNTHTVRVGDVEKNITSNTIAIVGSAPQYGQGVIDPIADLSKLAVKHQIGLHVDCCLGSFLLPILQQLNYDIPPFDFICQGVTSISADTHKYGYSCKGSSVVMFRNKELRKYGYFTCSDWSGGLYGTPTIGGSRSGAIIAVTWVALMAMGQKGYEEHAIEIMNAVDIIKKGIQNIPQIKIMGNPKFSVIAIESNHPKLNIFNVSDAMSEYGWNLNNCQNPDCTHICVTYNNKDKALKFVQDLKNAVQHVLENPGHYKEKAGSIYGTLIAITDCNFKDEILRKYIDVTLAP